MAAGLKQATVTRIIQDVQLLPSEASPRPAVVNDIVRQKTAVRTGADSRTELTFTDRTLTRLGANTLFSFNEGTRSIDLGGGAMLLSVPKGAATTRIMTAGVSAGISGGTALGEYHRDAYSKFIVLEGVARIYLRHRLGESLLLHAGQMIILKPDAKHLPDPVDIDLGRLMKTCLLIVGFPPLHNEPLIADAIQQQNQEKAKGTLYDTNMVIVGNGTLVSLVDPTFLDLLDQAINNGPGPGGGGVVIPEFGPLNTITSPNPYVITSGTKIRTAPTITTGGITQGGKIYRGNMIDGFASDYFFGSSSNFDFASEFNGVGEGANGDLPMATFRFTSLQITGNPTIKVPSGGATNLTLISEGNITSGAPGGTLTLNGMNAVLLATQNGSINLGPQLTFSNFNFLSLYARGAGSNVTIASPVLNLSGVSLTAEGSVTVNGNETVQSFQAFTGVDFLGGTGHVIAASDIGIMTGNNLDFTTANFAVTTGTPSVFLLATGNANLDIRNDQSIFANASFIFVDGVAENYTADAGGTTLMFNPTAQVQFFAEAGGIQALETTFLQTSNMMQFTSTGDIDVNSIVGADIIRSTAGSIHSSEPLSANTIAAAAAITSAADLTAVNSITAGTIISVTDNLISPSVQAGGNITAGLVEVQNINPNNALPSNTTLTAGGGGIIPFPGAGGSGLQHTFNLTTIVSPQGIDFTGSHFGPGANGGVLTINAQTQDFSSAGINGANFNGADAPTIANPAGSGGSLTVNTANALTVNGVDITATTGIIDTNSTPSGAGGSVSLNSQSGQVSLTNTRIQVSSSDPMGTANRRSSGNGGNINISSAATTGTAILIDNSAQLLSLLENTAPGPSGLITISASGANSSIQAGGQIEADSGSPTTAAHGIDIRHTGAAGQITLTNVNAHADIIKVAALGNNGTLTISGGMLSADTTLKLYAPGSNGQIVFVADCTIAGGNANILAANSVTINTGVTVTTQGHAADVYVNQTSGIPNANYTGFGGNASTTGTFAGLGATNPQMLSAAPVLGPPGGP